MKKIKKIKIKVNGKVNVVDEGTKLSNLIKKMKIPIKKVAIELNRKIINKRYICRIILKKNDHIEIVHFIGGG
jgi:thiamine biosynthesis protein ThiS